MLLNYRGQGHLVAKFKTCYLTLISYSEMENHGIYFAIIVRSINIRGVEIRLTYG